MGRSGAGGAGQNTWVNVYPLPCLGLGQGDEAARFATWR